LYVNRGITGAIVQRQPFGGWKSSSFGPGAKAGGPNYVLQLCQVADGTAPAVLDAPAPDAAVFLGQLKRHVVAEDHRRLAAAACAYQRTLRAYFATNHDPSDVLGELNVLRYLPCASILVRIAPEGSMGDALLACIAALTVGAKPQLSVEPCQLQAAPWLARLPLVQPVVEDDLACAERVRSGVPRVRAFGARELAVERAADAAGIHIAREPALLAGRVELLRDQSEQSLSVAYQRSGYCEGRRLLPWAAEP
jgi:RHH-type proline utilization regulon transcriptional repressor/proline dehydrogenase/delta 1-pyrroline-5-carboxylate dehydrogenase